VGLGISAPYGLITEYDANWVGRYYAIKSDLATININPTVAYRLNPQWSLGAGVSAQKIEATLSQKADLGAAFGFSTQYDGFSEVEGDDWGYGFNLGVMFEPVQSTRIGFAFRSSISHELEGDGKWVIPDSPGGAAQAVATALGFTDGADISAEVDLPETVSLALHHSLNDKLAVVADVTWTKWSRLDEIRIVYDSPQSDTVLDLQWDDTWRYGLGVIYKATDKCTGRFGVAFDETPIPDEVHRSARVPGEDRLWVSIGAGYKFTEKLDFNLGYTHIFVDDPKVDNTGTDAAAIAGALVGEWDASVDIISANLTYVF
jgi:long-chain fatty acid transport protein